MKNKQPQIRSEEKHLYTSEKGFSLIELLTVIAVIGILTTIAIPLYRGYITSGKQESANTVIEQFPILIETYRAENGAMCPTCNTNGTYTYNYTENSSGTENTVGNKITGIYPDFRAKGITSPVSLYHYRVVFTVTGCPGACVESALVTAFPQTGRGAPAGNIVGKSYR